MIKKLKHKNLIKIILFTILFIAIVVFYWFFSSNIIDKKLVSTTENSLPVLFISYDDLEVNKLYGYTTEMDPVYMRDTISPINEDNTMNITLKENIEDIKTITYEVKSIDGENLVQSSQVQRWDIIDGVIKFKLYIENIIEKDKEYILTINVSTTKNPNIKYYTRIILNSDNYYIEQIDFVNNFNQSTFIEDDEMGIVSYLEYDPKIMNGNNLGLVNIHSGLSVVKWGDLYPVQQTEPSIKIKEIINDVSCIELNYIIYTLKGDKKTYYNITEFYRVRVGDSRMYLLDFERKQDEIFKPDENDNVSKSSINLGIDSDLNIDLKTDFNNEYLAFVNQGNLWYMDINENSITKIFSFSDDSDTDYRKTNNEHDINIISVNESGDVKFLVYGYMNAGEHEGNVGIALYNYNSEEKNVEELLFVPSNRSYEILKEMIGEMIYTSDNGSLFLILDGYVYSIDLSGKEYVEIASGVKEDNYVTSYDRSMIAWHESGSVNNEEFITVLDLETGESCRIEAQDGTKIKALGFLEKDFVYGVALESDINESENVEYKFLISDVYVVNIQKQVQQHESGDGMYFVDASTGYNYLVLQRVKNNKTVDDLTIFSFTEKETQTEFETKYEETKRTVVYIPFINKVVSSKGLLITSIDEVYFDSEKILSVRELSSKSIRYFVYTKGGVSDIYSNLSEAIQYADDNTGVITDSNQNYIWVRGDRKSVASISGITSNSTDENVLAFCINELLRINGIHDVDVVSLLNDGGNSVRILDDYLDDRGIYLSGVSVDQTLYFLSNGQPIIGSIGNGEYLMIVGYDYKNITIFDPLTAQTYKVTQEEAEEIFSKGKNRFITILND